MLFLNKKTHKYQIYSIDSTELLVNHVVLCVLNLIKHF